MAGSCRGWDWDADLMGDDAVDSGALSDTVMAAAAAVHDSIIVNYPLANDNVVEEVGVLVRCMIMLWLLMSWMVL